MESSPAETRILILAGNSPATLFAVHRLFTTYPQTRWIMPDWSNVSSGRTRWTRLFQNPFARIARVARGKIIRQVLRARDAQLRQRLPTSPVFHGRDPDLVIPARQFNDASLLEQVTTWNPAVIITAGVPLLRSPWFSLAHHGCINVHFGIAPKYRGEHTLFYALLAQDWEQIGFTIHALDSGVDTGPVLAYGHPALVGTESEADLWAKTAMLAADTLPEVVELLLSGKSQPIQQTTSGRNIRYADRTVLDEIRLRLRRRPFVTCSERVHIFRNPAST